MSTVSRAVTDLLRHGYKLGKLDGDLESLRFCYDVYVESRDVPNGSSPRRTISDATAQLVDAVAALLKANE